ncbi:hypothetical protein ACS0PU_009327 [Formica fusca]
MSGSFSLTFCERSLAANSWGYSPCSVPRNSALSRATNVTGLSHVAAVSDGAPGHRVIYNFIRRIPMWQREKEESGKESRDSGRARVIASRIWTNNNARVKTGARYRVHGDFKQFHFQSEFSAYDPQKCFVFNTRRDAKL